LLDAKEVLLQFFCNRQETSECEILCKDNKANYIIKTLIYIYLILTKMLPEQTD